MNYLGNPRNSPYGKDRLNIQFFSLTYQVFKLAIIFKAYLKEARGNFLMSVLNS
jgi:hypothetical protein